MSLDHIILGIISIAPCSGYDMKMEFEKGGAGMLSSLSFGSIYPRLKQLELDGLVEIQEESESIEKRRRKVYELTAKGWQELEDWLSQPTQYPIPMRDDLLLKMLFWGATGTDRTTLMQHLQSRRQESSELLAYLVDWQHNGTSFVDEYTALTLKYIESRLEAELSWIAATLKQLESEPTLPPQDPQWLSVIQKARRTKALAHKEEPAQEQRRVP